jgi:hypothetical protein
MKRSEVCLFHKSKERSEAKRSEAKQSLFIPQIRKVEVEQTRLIPEMGKIKAKKRTGSK